MDLNELIPDNNPEWLIKKNVIYFRYLAYIPVLFYENNEVKVSLDEKVIKRVLSIAKHLENKGIEFHFIDPIIIKRNLEEKDEIRQNIINYMYALTSSKLFDGISKMEIDYLGNLSKYLVKNNAIDIFQEEFNRIDAEVKKRYPAYYTNDEEWAVPRSEIRDYISGMCREIKMGLIF